MNGPVGKDFSRRERQIMDIIYERGQASATEIREAMPDPPSYSAVRTLLSILEGKGHLRHQKQGAHYIYFPIQSHSQAARSALAQVVKTFFDSNIERAVTALLSTADTRLTPEELERLSALIEQARQEEEMP
jgi:predicted transcriptional regulator